MYRNNPLSSIGRHNANAFATKQNDKLLTGKLNEMQQRNRYLEQQVSDYQEQQLLDNERIKLLEEQIGLLQRASFNHYHCQGGTGSAYGNGQNDGVSVPSSMNSSISTFVPCYPPSMSNTGNQDMSFATSTMNVPSFPNIDLSG